MRPNPHRRRSACWLALPTFLLSCAQQPVVPAHDQVTQLAEKSTTTTKVIPRPAMKWVASPHFRRGPRPPAEVDAIAIHTTESGFNRSRSHARNQRQAYFGTINYFRNNKRRVSAHFVVGADGSITQMVREADIAHTTTYYNGRSFGIECAGWGAREATWTPALLDSLVELCAYLAVTWEVPVTHPLGTAYDGEHRRETENPKRPRFDAPGVVGHFQVQPWNKSDPGEHFPWQEFMRRLQARVADATPQPWERLHSHMHSRKDWKANQLPARLENPADLGKGLKVTALGTATGKTTTEASPSDSTQEWLRTRQAAASARGEPGIDFGYLIDSRGEVFAGAPSSATIALLPSQGSPKAQTQSLLRLLSYLAARCRVPAERLRAWATIPAEVEQMLPEDWPNAIRQRWQQVSLPAPGS